MLTSMYKLSYKLEVSVIRGYLKRERNYANAYICILNYNILIMRKLI